MTIVLFSGREGQADQWGAALSQSAADLNVPITLHTDPAAIAPEKVEVLVASPKGVVQDFAPYAGARLIQSFWAGMEGFLGNPTLPDGPALARMVEPGLTEGMTDYICAHTLRYHIDIDRFQVDSAAATWNPVVPPISRDRKVGVLGLGALGADAAQMLAALRFDVGGWSRTAKSIPGITCYHGADGLRALIARSEIIVTILPSTPDTRHILNTDTLALAPKGAAIINPGRGPLIDDDALLAALESGQIGHATLDVFTTEPLPDDHPYWRHPRVTVTPHIAAETRVSGAARVAIEQIGRLQTGEPLLHIVDRGLGY